MRGFMGFNHNKKYLEMVGNRGSTSTHLFPMCICFLIFIVSVTLPQFTYSEFECSRDPVIFNFGDSNSDTGGFYAGTGFTFGPPDGRSFFHKPSGRLCDGRLIIDFLCESLNIGYLFPYLESLGSNFTDGANFAVSGAATLPRIPFNLDVQIRQFLRFQARSLHLISQGYKGLLKEEDFKSAVYAFDIGQNDLAGSFFYFPYATVIGRIPNFITEIKNAIWSIYQNGGKNFWVHNTGPLGCSPTQISTNAWKYGCEVDEYGCLGTLHNAAEAFNKQLSDLCDSLRSQMKNAVIVYVDLYTIKYDLIANYAQYGFENPLIACCGYGGPPYNYNGNVTCGMTGFNVCAEGMKYVSWDGGHYTEAANAIFASKILSTEYSTPQVNLSYYFKELGQENVAKTV